MKLTYAEGRCFSITLEDGVVTCRVWERPDLDREEGARMAAVISGALRALAARPRHLARALVLDEREAPPVVGPRTQASIGELLAAWERQGRRVAYALGANPVKNVQVRRLIATWAPKYGRAFESIDWARAWVTEPDAGDAAAPSTKAPAPSTKPPAPPHDR